MIEQLSLNDSLWRKTAFTICKDKDTADEIVQEMYLRFERIKSTEPKYIFSILRNIFYDTLKSKEVLESDFTQYETTDDEYQEPTIDTFRTKEEFKELLQPLTWYERTTFELSNQHGQRKLSRMTGIRLQTIHEINKKVKKQIAWQIKENQSL